MIIIISILYMFDMNIYFNTNELMGVNLLSINIEKNTFDISAQDLVDEITKIGRKAIYMSDFHEIAQYIKDHAINNDIVLTVGAGTVTKIGPMLVDDSDED